MARIKSILLLTAFILVVLGFFVFTQLAYAATVVCDTTSSLTIPGAQNIYSMNFNCAVPASATASLAINWTAVGDRDGRDYFKCGSSVLYTTSEITAPLPKLMTTDISTCLRGYNLSTGNRICTANAWSSNCGGYYYGLAAGHSTMEYARLTVTYTDGSPLVLTTSPTDNSTTFNMIDNLVIYFDRATYVGTGNITIKKGSDNSTVETIDVTSGKVTGSGGPTITINPDADLIKNTAYYVQIDSTAFNDGAGNNYAGISNTTAWNFNTLNIIPPTTQATNLVFSSVTSNSLTLSWTNGNGGGRMVFAKQANTGTAAPVEYTNYTANAAFGSGDQIGSSGWYAIYAGTGTSVTVTNLSAETNYIFHVVEYNTVSNAKNYFTDAATNNPSIAFITTAVCNTTSSLTVPGAQNPYSMNFNCAVPTSATASLEIKWTAVGDNDGRDYFMCGGSLLYTTSDISAPYPKTMTTNVSTCLRGYNLTTGNRICTANAWNSNCGGYYYGLTAGHSTMEYARLTFTYTAGSPSVLSFSPADNNTTASATGNLLIYFDRSTYVGTGNITIKKSSDNSTVEAIDVTSGQVTGSGTSAITIDPSATLDGDTAYYIQIDATAFNDNNGNNYAGISNTTAWNFTTIDSTAPTVQTSNLAFSSVAYNSLTLGWTNGNGDGRIIFAKQANTGTASPVDSTNYTASASFGAGTQIGSTGWYTLYKGTGTSVAVTSLTANKDYIFQAFEYDLAGSNPLFFTDTATANPATQTTPVVPEPTTQATNMSFSSVSYTTMTVSWTSGNGSRRVVFAKQANTGTASPVDDTAYTASSTFGSGTQIGTSGWYCIYDGTGSSVSVSGLTANTDYIFEVFEYNQSGAYYNYIASTGTNNPKSQTSLAVIAPVTQTTNIVFSSVAATTMSISWTSGNGGKRAVFIKQANTGTATPVDNTNYTANTVFGSGTQIGTSGWYCIYNSTGSSVSVSGLTANTDYIVQIFDYNTSGSTYVYNANSATNNPKYQTTLATEPTTQATSVTFSSVASTSFVASWTNGNGANRAVFVKAASSGSATPVDATTYTANAAFGSGTQISASGWYNVYNGTGNSVTVTGLTASTAYRVQVFEYNGSTGGQNYFNNTATGNPANQTTSGGYTLTYSAGANGSITGTTPQSITSGGNGTQVTAVPNTGYHFTSWDDGTLTAARTDTNVTANHAYTASFAINTYTLAYVAGAHGSLTGSTTQMVNYNSNGSAVTAVADSGYHFVNWSDGSTANPRTDTSVAGNVTVTANFDITSYTITYTAGSNGSITGTSPQSLTSGGNGTQVTAVPNTGYHFTSWDDGTLTAARTDTNVTANHAYTASFAINTYTLAYVAGAHGSLTGSTTQMVNYGNNGSAVVPVPASGYEFADWSDGSAANPRTDSSVSGNVSVTANFSVIVPDVIYVNSATGNDTTGDGTTGNPYKTFYKGYSVVTAGKTLDLSGTFSWTDTAEMGDVAINGFVINKNLTIRGQDPEQTILQAANYDNIADRRIFTIASGVTVTIQNLALRYGKLTGSSDDGGATRNNGILTINDCEIYNNRALGAYGGAISNWNKLNLNRSTVYNNVANYMGGGLVNSFYVGSGGFLNITNSTIVYNLVTAVTAYTEGGGVHYRKGGGTITNSTIAYNKACGAGGIGMDDPSGVLTLKNNIIAKNLRLNSTYCQNGLGPVDFGFRQTGNGNVVDNGNNIVGYSSRYTWTGDHDWIGATNWSQALAWNQENFRLNGSATTTGNLKLDTSLAVNGSSNKTQTLGLNTGSIAINAGALGSNGLISVPAADQRGTARSGGVDIGSFEFTSAPVDITPPVISDIATSTTNTTATITWSTDEESSSQIKFDPGTYISTHSPIYNSSIRTIGHQVILTDLVPCTKYYFATVSQDSYGNIAASDMQDFMTTGCAGSAPVATISELTFVPAQSNGNEVDGTASDSDSDYVLSQTQGNMTFSLTIPRTFYQSPANLQLKSLEADTALNSLSKPSGFNKGGSSVFDLKALIDPTSALTSFDSSATVIVSYTESDIVGLDESTLQIYRNDGSSWSALEGCSVSRNAHTVTCSTNHFSTFGLFGQSSSSGSNSGGGMGSAPAPAPAVGGGANTAVVAMAQAENFGSINSLGLNVLSYINSSGDFTVLVSKKKIEEAHHFKITGLDLINNIVTVTFWSQPQEIKLALGQSRSIDLDGDTVDDLEVKFVDLQVNRVELTLKTKNVLINNNFIFKKDLKFGQRHNDIKELQKYLNANGFVVAKTGVGSLGKETNYFGTATKNALIKFQKVNQIKPAAGYFGKITRDKINNQKSKNL